MSSLISRVAERHLATGIYDDLNLDDSAEIGETLKNVVDRLKHDAHEALERARDIERAWEKWDVDTLVSLGALSERDRDRLRKAWAAQQEGDEDTMYQELEMHVPGHLRRGSESDSFIDHVIPPHDVYKLIHELEKEKDEQSADLAARVYSHLSAKLRLSDREGMALNRLRGSVQSVGAWDVAMQRNNIFKAADLLGMKLPSYMFASEKKAGFGDYTDLKLKVKGALTVAEEGVFRARGALNELADWVGERGGRSEVLLRGVIDRLEEIELELRPFRRLVR